jgi:uncharacterized membrane protein
MQTSYAVDGQVEAAAAGAAEGAAASSGQMVRVSVSLCLSVFVCKRVRMRVGGIVEKWSAKWAGGIGTRF